MIVSTIVSANSKMLANGGREKGNLVRKLCKNGSKTEEMKSCIKARSRVHPDCM